MPQLDMTTMGLSNLAAAAAGIVGAALGAGDKPKVPDFIPTDINKALRESTGANLANFDEVTKLADKTNRFNTEQIASMLSIMAPDWESVVAKQRELIDAELSGEIPRDVQDQLWRSGAGRALSGGTAGSQFGKNLVARDFGLTSLDITNKGFAHAEQWLASASARTPQPLNFAQMFITPQQSIENQRYNNEGQFQRNWMQNLIDASPDPFMAAVGNAISQSLGGAAVPTNPYMQAISEASKPRERGYDRNTDTTAPNQMDPMAYNWQNGGGGGAQSQIPWDSFGSPSVQSQSGGGVPWDSFGSPSVTPQQSGGVWDNASWLTALGG